MSATCPLLECSRTGGAKRKEKDLKCSVCDVFWAKSKKGLWIYDDDENESDRVGAYCIQLAVGDTTGKHSDVSSLSGNKCRFVTCVCSDWSLHSYDAVYFK